MDFSYNRPGDLGIVDIFKDGIENGLYRCGINQKMFGLVPDLDEFISSSRDTITISPSLELVNSLAASRYPFDMCVNYESDGNGRLNPIFGNRIKHRELICRLSEDDLGELDGKTFGGYVERLAKHREKRLGLYLIDDRPINISIPDAWKVTE